LFLKRAETQNPRSPRSKKKNNPVQLSDGLSQCPGGPKGGKMLFFKVTKNDGSETKPRNRVPNHCSTFPKPRGG